MNLITSVTESHVMSRKRFYKRGRKKQERPIHDLGTPELIAKRMAASPKDPTRSTCPINVLSLRRIITGKQHAAASHFRAVRLIVFGSPHAKATDLLRVSGRTPTRSCAHEEAAYRSACQALVRRSHHHMNAIEDLVVHEKWPSWVEARGRKNSHSTRQRTCLEALDILADWHEALPRADENLAAE